jgi:hypothetical protein
VLFINVKHHILEEDSLSELLIPGAAVRRSGSSQEACRSSGPPTSITSDRTTNSRRNTSSDLAHWSRQSLPPLPQGGELKSADQSAGRNAGHEAKTTTTGATCRPPVKKVKRSGSSRRPRSFRKAAREVHSTRGLDTSERAEKYRSITEFESTTWLLRKKDSSMLEDARDHFCR